MSKYIIDTGDYSFTTDGVLVVGSDCDNKPATFYNSLDNLEELNSDYINEHFGELQDEAYKRGYEDGKWKAEDGCDGCKYYEDTSLTNPCSECSRGHVDRYEPLSDPDRIEVGDEVEVLKTGSKYLIAWISGSTLCGFSYAGITCRLQPSDVRKTGRHFDIQSILEAMRNDR